MLLGAVRLRNVCALTARRAPIAGVCRQNPLARCVLRSLSSSPADEQTTERMSWRELEVTSTQDEVIESVVPQVQEVLPIIESAKLDHWPADYALRFVDAVHSGFDAPWWAAIALSTLFVRTALLPISLETMRHTGRMQKAKPELEVLQARIAADQNKEPARAAMYQRQMQALLAKHDVKMWLIFAFPLAQLPVFTSMFFGLQRLGTHFPDAQTGGLFWFCDLTVADPFYALPIATSLLFLGMIEVGADGAAAATQQGRTFKYIMRLLAFLMIPFTSTMPASVFCYWLTANAFSLCQTLVLNKMPGARTFLKLPPLPRHNPSTSSNALGELKEAWTKAKDALAAAANKDKPPQVAAQVFDQKKQHNAFLASRPHDKVKTFTRRPGKKPGASVKST